MKNEYVNLYVNDQFLDKKNVLDAGALKINLEESKVIPVVIKAEAGFKTADFTIS